MFGVGLGALTRHITGGIVALMAVVFVVPMVFAGRTGTTMATYFPTLIAGNSPAVAVPLHDMLAPWTGFHVLCLCTLLMLGAGALLLERRDV